MAASIGGGARTRGDDGVTPFPVATLAGMSAGAPSTGQRRQGEALAPPLPAAPLPSQRGSALRLIVKVVAALLLLGAGALTLLAVGLETGAAGFALGGALAVLPAVLVVATLLWLDRYEAEPALSLGFALAWGAAVATLVALVVNTGADVVIDQVGGPPAATAVVVAPLVEESAKGIGVLLVILWRRKSFDGVVDGIVYAGMVGVGFAFVENILYLGRAFSEEGAGGLTATFVVRCIFSPFAHPLFTVATGIGLGLALSRRSWAVRFLAPAAGWSLAVALHAAWNGAASLGPAGLIGGYVLVQVPIFAGAVVVAVLARRREGRVLRRHLQAYAGRGWFSDTEVAMLSSLHERARARDRARRTLGDDAGAAMKAFQERGTELAFLRQRMVAGIAGDDALQVELATLATMWHLRPRFLPQVVAPGVPGGPAPGSPPRG